MRRPLCAAGLVFISVVFLYVMKILPRIPDYSELEGRSFTIAGITDRRESREYDGRPVTYVYVRLNEDVLPFEKGSVLKCVLSDPEAGPKTGSGIKIKGLVEPFSKARNPGSFDNLLYQRSLGICCSLKNCIILYETEEYDHYREALSMVREYLGMLLDRVFGEDDGSILRAVTLGDKTALDSETKAMYQRNGIIHILAVSGLHISVLGAGLYRMLKKTGLPSAVSVSLAVFFMYSYGQMCGSSASAVRAITMFSIRMGAVLLHRTYDLLTALTAAALMILASSPLYITQAGFLFSFSAVFAVGAVSPVTDDILMLRGIKGRRKKLISAFSSGADIALITLPIHTGFYYSFPVISLVINLIVIPLMTVVMAGAIVSMALGAVFLPLAFLPAFPVKMILRLYEGLCTLGDMMPVNNVITGCPAPFRIVIYYALISIPLIFHRDHSPATFLTTVLAAASLLVFRPCTGFGMTFLDVGQGDCIYITDGRGTDILTDGGSTTEMSPGERIIEPFLKYNGIDELDCVFITHLDADHYNGIMEMIEMSGAGCVKIKQILLNECVVQNGGEKLKELSDLCDSLDIPLRTISKGDMVNAGDLTVRCLYPESTRKRQDLKGRSALEGTKGSPYPSDGNEDMNSLSTVLRVEYRDFTCLLTGDIQDTGEEKLTEIIRSEEGFRDTDILKVAHHGSKNSTPAEFLELTKPAVSIISAGKDNSYGHPHRETLKRLDDAGSLIYSTKEYGAISVTLSNENESAFCINGYLNGK
ncbi:MAG: DNA internalization-related competence protein ComEC/Rec2 [Lachnospiraceae bacterium]|nr:DNA internalization-related competence protein ComEC/Rec2 [Lachnospiraceae bacterium]